MGVVSPESGRGTYILRAQKCSRTLLYKILEPPLCVQLHKEAFGMVQLEPDMEFKLRSIWISELTLICAVRNSSISVLLR
jgi:hypothetical protein